MGSESGYDPVEFGFSEPESGFRNPELTLSQDLTFPPDLSSNRLIVQQQSIPIISSQFLFHTIVVQVKHKNIRIMLDPGSSHTIINHDIAKFLQAKMLSKEDITIENMHGEEHYHAHKCEFLLPKNTKISAYSVNSELCPIEMDINLINKSWPNLDETIMHDILRNTFDGNADILIGVDNFWKLELTNILPHNSHRFGLLKTKYGWTLAGNLSEADKFRGQANGYCRISVNVSKVSNLETQLKKLFNRDEETENESQYSYEEEYAIKLFQSTIKQLPDGQYVVNPLFRKEAVKLRNNYFLALIRFNSLRKSLKRHRDKFDLYNTALKDMLEDETIEEVVEKPEMTKNMSKFFGRKN